MKKQLLLLVILITSLCNFSCSKSNDSVTPGGTSSGPIDNALLGDWKFSDVSTIEISNDPGGTTSIPSGKKIDLKLKADGTYTLEYYNQSSLGCTIIVYGITTGKWHVDNSSTIYFDENSYYLKTTDDCNSAYNSENHLPLSRYKNVYHKTVDSAGKDNLVLKTIGGDNIYYR